MKLLMVSLLIWMQLCHCELPPIEGMVGIRGVVLRWEFVVRDMGVLDAGNPALSCVKGQVNGTSVWEKLEYCE